MTSEEQLSQWIEGKPACPNDGGECCPDFSCCEPEFLTPKDEREAFNRADDEARHSMLMTFLGRALSKHLGKKKRSRIHIAGLDAQEPEA